MPRPIRPMPGMVTPATIGWNMVSSSWRPRKYHGAFEGLGVRLKLAWPSKGALTKAENTSRNAVIASAAVNSTTSRCGQTCTLSVGVALTSWIEPAFTTVSRRWVCPAGPTTPAPAPAPVTRAAAATPAPAPGVAVATAPPPPPLPPSLPPAAPPAPPPAAAFSRAAWERARRCAGILPDFSASALDAATSSADGPAAAAAGASSAGAAPPDSAAFFASSAALRSAARFRRCSGTSAMREPFPRLQRTRDAAILPNPPEVDGHEDDDDEREHQDMEHVPAQQRRGTDLHASK